LSPAGAQPMVDPASGDALTYNGELYNYRSLREKLGPGRAHSRSTGDTAVLLGLLEERGDQALASLRGMFAFGFWSAERRRLLLARDSFGIKPLYLARDPARSGTWSLAFASEVLALLASGLLGRPQLDPAAVASVVWNGFVVGPHTAVAGVE